MTVSTAGQAASHAERRGNRLTSPAATSREDKRREDEADHRGDATVIGTSRPYLP